MILRLRLSSSAFKKGRANVAETSYLIPEQLNTQNVDLVLECPRLKPNAARTQIKELNPANPSDKQQGDFNVFNLPVGV